MSCTPQLNPRPLNSFEKGYRLRVKGPFCPAHTQHPCTWLQRQAFVDSKIGAPLWTLEIYGDYPGIFGVRNLFFIRVLREITIICLLPAQELWQGLLFWAWGTAGAQNLLSFNSTPRPLQLEAGPQDLALDQQASPFDFPHICRWRSISLSGPHLNFPKFVSLMNNLQARQPSQGLA